MVTGNPSITLKIASKSPRCIGSNLASAALRSCQRIGQNHLAHGDDAVAHRRTYARCGKARCLPRRSAARSPHRRAYRHWRGLSVYGSNPPSPSACRNRPVSSGWRIGTRPLNTWPVAPSMVMMSPRAMVTLPAAIVPRRRVDLQHARAGHAGPPHAARHNRRVARHAAARGENALRRMHAVNVFGAGFRAHEDHGVAVGGELLGFIRGERDFAGGRARRCGKADRNRLLWAHRDRASDAAIDRALRDRRAPPPCADRSALRPPYRRRS